MTRLGLLAFGFARRSRYLVLPAVGVVVALLAIAFHEASGRAIEEVLFSGQDALPGWSPAPATWSISALLLLLAFKGLAWGVSLGSFRGGPTFPALFLGAAAGILASHLPGFDLTGAVAVGMGAGAVSVLRLPLSCVVLASVLVSQTGAGSEPLIIVGVVVAYLVTVGLDQTLGVAHDGSTSAPSLPRPASSCPDDLVARDRRPRVDRGRRGVRSTGGHIPDRDDDLRRHRAPRRAPRPRRDRHREHQLHRQVPRRGDPGPGPLLRRLPYRSRPTPPQRRHPFTTAGHRPAFDHRPGFGGGGPASSTS